jgi:hypothetical protein
MTENGIREILAKIEQVKRNLWKNRADPAVVEKCMSELDKLTKDLEDYDKGKILSE